MVLSDLHVTCLCPPLLGEISCETRARHDKILPKQLVLDIPPSKSIQNIIFNVIEKKREQCFFSFLPHLNSSKSKRENLWKVKFIS